MTALLTLAWCGGPQALLAADATPAPAPAPATRPSAAELERLSDKMRRGFAAMEALTREMPRDTFDPQAIIEQVGRDPLKLFAWVRDHTFWVPYEGTLRGPTGVLMDRLGNSLDRSLLLATLLESGGNTVRLAHARLEDGQAEAVLASARPVPTDPLASQQDRSDGGDDSVTTFVERFGLDAASLKRTRDDVTAEVKTLTDEAQRRVAAQVKALSGFVAPPAPKDRSDASALAAARDHWWVQLQREGAWTDFDVVSADAQPGRPVAQAQKTVDPGKLDAALIHSVRIRVLVEQWDGGKLTENVALQHVLRPSELFGLDVSLAHNPIGWPKDVDVEKATESDAALLGAARQLTEWLPTLRIGRQVILQSSFTDAGIINKNPTPDPVAKAGSAIGGAFGGALGGSDPERQVGPRLTAEWIEYEITTPGQPRQTIRRAIFDTLGPAARAKAPAVPDPGPPEKWKAQVALALIGQTDILPLVCQLSDRYVEQRGFANAFANREALEQMVRAAQSGGTGAAAREARFERMSGDLFALALARSLWSPHGTNVFLDRINLLTYHSQMGQATDGGLFTCEGYDIVANDIAVRPGVGIDPFAVRLAQGVVDTNAESLLMNSCGQARNTASLFQRLGGREWVTIRDATSPLWKQLPLPEDVRTRIEQDLAAGMVVVVPSSAPAGAELAWWRVDPTTGATLGIGHRGWGASLTEERINNARIALNVLDGFLCIRAMSKSKMGRGAQFAGMAACVLKSGFKGTKLIQAKNVPKLDRFLFYDLMSDISGTLIGYGVKEFGS